MTISATSGLISNIDYESLITQLIRAKEQPIDALSADKKNLEKASSAFSTLSSRVSDLRSAADELRSSLDFKVFTISVSDSTILGASATSSAAAGSHEIKVNTLAKAHSIAADGVSLATSVIATGAGFFKFKVGSGVEQSVAVDATTTLTGLRDAINNLNAGVTASIVNDGGATKPYRLVLTSTSTGSSSAITVTQNDTWTENGAPLNFATTLQGATDASIVVDGMTYTRSSNSVSDILTGITLDLKSADAAKTVTLTVGRDTEDIKKKIVAIVDKYNAVISYIKAKNRYDTDTDTAGEFFGDPSARSVLDDLRRKMTSAVAGLPDAMNRLIHLGVKSSSADGQLTTDTAKLSDALSSSFASVQNFFAGDGVNTGFAQGLYDLCDTFTNSADGRLKTRQDGIKKSIESIEKSVRNKEYELSLYESDLRARFTALETVLAGLKTRSSYLTSLGG